ncbi:MAG: thymidine phosphorylase [Ignavibacterium album]|uniref:thymidine phosphorylase n=1 Tax=Ignavibacterium album TaxID=591197 RepID=UPI0026E975CA|nr:thymidine phosphorylase [Ignavibacterium album]MBI5662474.1 thymidine phosphorylase [Ignavibacterium album]
MNTIEIIRKKRDNHSLTKEEIEFLISAYTKGKIPDYQFSAFLMAAFLNGLNKNETAALTEAMLYSGKVVDLSSIKGVKVDKHSTGGVGDKTSLIIAPIAAAAGVYVPMISGRGLGHTGGTLDKLESIPGFRTNLNLTEYKNVLKKTGAVLIGQTKEIAPADKLIYSLRDVTATVESIPLITGSIMSKKLAEGIDALVLDVKTGNGAFMREMKDAEQLAYSLYNTAKAFGKKCVAFITDMNQPLGNYIGNWLEVYESIQVLRDGKKNDLTELSLILAGAMIYLGRKAKSFEEGIEKAITLLNSGKAFDKFLELVKVQGGDISYIKNPDRYPKSRYHKKIKMLKDGFISFIDTYEIGMAAIDLGAGRLKKEDKIDPKAGIIFNYKLGDKINKGDVIAEVFSDSNEKINLAEKRILNSIKLSERKTKIPALVKQIIN